MKEILPYFQQKVLPAVTVGSVKDALKLAEAYSEGGLHLMEITFRTSITVQAIEAIRTKVPGMIIGAGTILTSDQAKAASDAGAHFGLAPGFNPEVVHSAHLAGLPFIPGVMTPSEIERAMAKGCTIQKLFPINLIGQTSMLKSLEGPYRHTDLTFIPMGGIDAQNMNEYLAFEQVLAVGGSWLCDLELIRKGAFDQITNLVKDTLRKLQGK